MLRNISNITMPIKNKKPNPTPKSTLDISLKLLASYLTKHPENNNIYDLIFKPSLKWVIPLIIKVINPMLTAKHDIIIYFLRLNLLEI